MAAEGGRHSGRRLATVRARTTLAATLILGAALVVGGTALVTVLGRSLVNNVDQVAALRAEDVAALASQRYLPETLGVEDDSAVQIVDHTGRVIAASSNVAGKPAISRLQPSADEPAARTVHDVPGLSGEFRLLALRSGSAFGPVTVYVATSLEPATEALALVRTGLLVGGPVLLALVAAVTWFTVGRALHPVEAIRAQVTELSSRDLGRRVTVPATDDEISRLADTMNSMLDRLQASADKQHRFVANASHELQTPLAAARADLEVALAHPEATAWPETARDLLEENRRMERLVADLLFIARADNTSPATPSPVDLHDVVLEEAARLTACSGARIDTTAVAVAFVLGRRDDLGRVVRNLLDNAARHAIESVSIGLSEDAGVVRLVVEDDGPGVPPGQRERIFERFARIDDARSRGAGGTGLGLAIVKEIIELHNGAVSVEGRPKGARFVVHLPADS